MMTNKLPQTLPVLLAVALAGLVSTSALADKIKDAGSMDVVYANKDAQPIPDQENHVLLLTESNGTSVNPGGLVDGFSVSIRELADLRQGSGSHQGYVIYQKDSDQEVVKFDGLVTTTMKNGQPNTTFKGTYVIVNGVGPLAGIEGEGTYAGYFTTADKYHVDWQGTRSAPKNAMADTKN